jgi:hypothetical protein
VAAELRGELMRLLGRRRASLAPVIHELLVHRVLCRLRDRLL